MVLIYIMYYIGLTLIGVVTGLLAGILGGGVEILIVPLLTFFGLLGSLKNRIATSLLMLLPPIGIFAAMNFYKDGYGDVFAAMYMALIFTIFSWISSKYLKKTNEIVLRKFFGFFTVLAGLYIYFNKA